MIVRAFKAALFAGAMSLSCATLSIAQEIEVQGLANVREEFGRLEAATDSVAARDQQTGLPLLQLVARPATNSALATELGQKNERIRAVQDLFLAADQVGIRAEKVGLTDYVRFEATRQELEALAATVALDIVVVDRASPPSMASASINIQIPALHGEGAEGLGKTVVILDTGVDGGHPDFGGRITAEACFSRNNAVATSLCPNGQNQQTGVGSGVNCDDGDVAACDHGTHVAGIAAGRRPLANASGVAPEANIIAVQVFSRFANAASCAPRPAPCVLTYNSDQLAALSYVRQVLMRDHPIAAINMSLGGGRETTCPNDIRAGEITALRRLGVSTVISSGNDGFQDDVGAPGCIPDAITVGAVNDNGVIEAFSNSGDAVDFLAPGADVTAATPNNGHERKWGTSMAAPMVSGLIAALQGHYTVSVDQIEDILGDTGLQRPTLNAARTRPWVQAHDAWQALDDLRPSGEFVWMRDQWADTGVEPNNTGLSLSGSPYIWFRHQADCEPAEHQSQDPEFGSVNFGCVKIHNSGRASASGTLQMFFSNANFDSGASWTMISSDSRTLPPNTTAVFEFPWASVPNPGHYCSIARWVPDGSDLGLSFPGGFINSVRTSNDLVWRNFNTVDQKSGQFASSLGFESNHDGVVNMVVDMSALSPEEIGAFGELIIELGGDPGDLSNEPTSENYEHEGRYIIIPLRPGVSYIPDIQLPLGEEVSFELLFRFDGIEGPDLGQSLLNISISDVSDVAEHKNSGRGELSSMNYEITR